MINLQTNLQFYDDIEKQYHRVYYNCKKKGCETETTNLPAFQFGDTAISTINSIILYNTDGTVYSDITNDISLYQYTVSGYSYVIYYGDDLTNELDEGVYYLCLTDSVNEYYSDLINVCNNLTVESITTIERYRSIESTTTTPGTNARGTIYHLTQADSTYRYFDGQTITLDWDGDTRNIFISLGYTLSQLRSTGWKSIANFIKSDSAITSAYNVTVITDSYGDKGILFEATSNGTFYNLEITENETYADVTDYTTNANYAGSDDNETTESSTYLQTIDIPQPWKWYDSLDKAYFKKYFNSYKKGAVQVTNDQFIPFQVRRDHIPYNLTHWYLKNPNDDSIVIDLLPLLQNEPVINYVEEEQRDYIIYYGLEKLSSEVSCGIYYCELTDGVNTWYSDLIQVYGENIIPHQTTYGLWTEDGIMAYKTGGYSKWRD